MTPILEPITAGLIVSLFNRFVIPRIVQCLSPVVDTDDHESSDSSESSAVNADVEIHVH
jgi:hypothetical protein